jgi:hypothetical protein
MKKLSESNSRDTVIPSEKRTSSAFQNKHYSGTYKQEVNLLQYFSHKSKSKSVAQKKG